jgi:hypothetical protein
VSLEGEKIGEEMGEGIREEGKLWSQKMCKKEEEWAKGGGKEIWGRVRSKREMGGGGRRYQ